MPHIGNILAVLILIASELVIGLTFCLCDSLTNSELFKTPFMPGLPIFTVLMSVTQFLRLF